ncbi:hypothetical protein ALO46_102579 [Pseudomonas syringae pv. solidagae]|uniref:Uncharacterized protein n=1 Tax=Pseudomonas syringae pv. solidagae TaxID=264458 RepID=A0A0Q0C744_PSESX|nr:hypothetical protein ALO46_102579 [Pseudomonas syringae pv. solidagae]RMT39862.1 hypothetical protein ALP48_102532 [Pseudomonas syringae pv. solidagae]RMT41507.1 hypothetical protein ALP49_102595 [Pseudomonas syringae pv. solidagae]
MSCAMPCDPRKGCYTRLRRDAATPALQKQKAVDNDKERWLWNHTPGTY